MADPSSIADLNLGQLSESDKREVQQFLVNEAQKSTIQKAVHDLTETCWKKCVTGPVASNKLNGAEEPCMQNCVNRFLDTNFAVLKHLEKMRGQI